MGEFKETLKNELEKYHKMRTIRSKLHEVSSVELNKKSLSCYDDKRYLENDGITTRAYGWC